MPQPNQLEQLALLRTVYLAHQNDNWLIRKVSMVLLLVNPTTSYLSRLLYYSNCGEIKSETTTELFLFSPSFRLSSWPESRVESFAGLSL